MKNWKRFGALLCAMTLAFALAACGGNGGNADQKVTEDPAKILTDAEAKLAAAKSMQAKMVMDMDIKMTVAEQSRAEQNITMKTNTVMDMAVFSDPMKMKMDMVMKMDGGTPETTQEIKTENYVVEKDGVYTMYSNAAGAWAGTPMDASEIESMDPQDAMSLYMGSGDNFKKDKDEDIDGQKATKYTGVISNEQLNKVMDASGVADSMKELTGDTGIDMATLYKDMGELPMSIWISEDGYPVRYTMDMTEMMDKLFAKIVEQMGDQAAGITMTCEKVNVTMDCSNFDKVEDFTLPTEIAQ